MEWTFNNKKVDELPEDCEAFVYLITNLTNDKKYVGKKLAKFKTTKPPLKGKKNKRRGTKESDWRTYWGSSDHLNEDVLALGQDKFKREILYFCPSRGVAVISKQKNNLNAKFSKLTNIITELST